MHLSRCAHSPGRRPRLILYKALTLASLVLAAMLLSSPAARAGTWQFTCTGRGNVTTTYSQYTIDYWGQPSPTVYNWVPPTAPQSGSFNLGSTFGGGSDYTVSTVASIKVTVTATWKPDTTLPSDPAPPYVWLCESSRVDWSSGHSGTLQDGFGDPAVTNQGTSGQTASTSPGTSLPPAHWTKVTVSGGTAKLPERTLSAESDSPVSADFPHGDLCVAHIDDYSVTVHATPYNFKKVVGGGNIGFDGTLSFTYDWLSTDGNRNDLTTCYWREYVTYPGPVGTAANPNQFYPQNPPFNFVPGVSWLNNPYVNPPPPSLGNLMTGPTATDTQNVPPLVDPSLYTYGTFTATQVFQYTDTATGDSNIQIPGPDSGPFSIVREFKSYDPNNYRYTVTKDGKMSFVLKPF